MKRSQPAHRPVRYHLIISGAPGFIKAEEKALAKIIRTACIDEVMFFMPNAEERCLGMSTIEECNHAAAAMAPWFARLRKQGVAPSIDVFWTMGFSNFPQCARDQHGEFSFRWAVSIDGRESRIIACPRDNAWREHIVKVYRVFAGLKPTRMWLNDDMRLSLRGDLYNSPCFCDVCLGEMETRTGRKRTRGELLRAIMADPPNATRDAWLEFQGDLLRDITAMLATAIHEESPETHVGLMIGPMEVHSAEGRCWQDMVTALGRPTPCIRPHLGPYTEGLPFHTAEGFNATRYAHAMLPEGATLAPEVENYPYSRFAKSARVMTAQMALCQLIGLNEATVNMYPQSGRLDLEHEDIWERSLAEWKPFFQSIADLGVTRDQLQGIAVYWNDQVCRHVYGLADSPKPIFLYRQRPLDSALPLLGIATKYGTGDVTVLTAELPHCLSNEELERMFSGGVLLDARAAEFLLRMGRGELAGVVKRLPNARTASETVEDKAFGSVGESMSTRLNGACWQFELAKGARVISAFRAFGDKESGHGVFLYENSLGGRVAVLPYDTQNDGVSLFGMLTVSPMLSATFLTWARQEQLRSVLEWLGRKPVPLFVPGAPNVFPILADQGTRLVVGVANLQADPIKSLTLRLAKPRFPIRTIRSLQPDGSRKRLKATIRNERGGVTDIGTGLRLEHYDVAALVLE